MSHRDDSVEPLDAELQELLALERPGVRPAPGAEHRVLARLEQSIAVDLQDAPSSEDSGADALPHDEPAEAAEMLARAVHAAAGPSGLGAVTLGSTWGMAIGGGLFALGVTTGAVLHAAWTPDPPAPTGSARVELPSPTATTSAPASSADPLAPTASRPLEPDPEPTKDSATPDAPTRSPRPEQTPAPLKAPSPAHLAPLPRNADASGSGGSGASKDAQLAEENLLIGRAQTALARRDPRAAQVALDLHESKFKGGQLAFERDLLRRETAKMLRELEANTPREETRE